MRLAYQRPEAEFGEFIPGLSLLEDSGNMSGTIDDLDLVNDTWDY